MNNTKSKKRNKRAKPKREKLQRNIASSNTVIIPTVTEYDSSLSADFAHGFGFTTANLWVNGASYQSITGASEIAAVFDLMRLVKVEVTMLPGYNMLEITNSTAGGVNALPWLYHAFDPNDSTNPSLTDMQGMSSLVISDFVKAQRRTIFPNLLVNSASVDLGRQRNTEFVKAGDNTLQWCAFKMYVDCVASTYAYMTVRVSFKCFFECTASK